jgi:GDP-L-fucose synthase
MLWRNNIAMKILITGGTGMVGSAFKDIDTKDDLILIGSLECDLVDYKSTVASINKYSPDAIIHLAARVGGVKGNSDYVADFYSDNIRINTNVLLASHALGVKKVLSLLSTCIYPDKATYPLTEDQIHNGPPHQSNFGYAYAKRMLDVQSRAYRQQYGSNFITAVPNNLFGEHDNFDLENGHVIPSIIRKVYEAKQSGSDITLWGDGTPLREFTCSKDLAKILLFLLEKYDRIEPINVGSTSEYSIKDIAMTIADILDYQGSIVWDTSKPKGQMRKPSDNSKLLNMGWNKEDYSDFRTSLEKTCQWFSSNYPNVRGVK